MENKTNKIYILLQDIFKNTWEQQKYAEVKNGVLLTLNVAIFVVIIRVYFNISSTINHDNFKIWFYILMLVFICHMICMIQSFFPKDSNKEKKKWNYDEINIFFFGDIQKLESKEYLEILTKKIDCDSSTINKSPLLDLSNQIVKLSEITQSKYSSFKWSIYRMYFLGFLFIIYFTILFF